MAKLLWLQERLHFYSTCKSCKMGLGDLASCHSFPFHMAEWKLWPLFTAIDNRFVLKRSTVYNFMNMETHLRIRLVDAATGHQVEGPRLHPAAEHSPGYMISGLRVWPSGLVQGNYTVFTCGKYCSVFYFSSPSCYECCREIKSKGNKDELMGFLLLCHKTRRLIYQEELPQLSWDT